MGKKKKYRLSQYRVITGSFFAVFTVLFSGLIKPLPLSSLLLDERFWILKVHGRTRYDIVVAGDSRIYRGFDPTSFAEGLGTSDFDVLNFGFSSGGHNPEMFRAAKQKLKSASNTRAIVLGITPFSLTPATLLNEQYRQELSRGRVEIVQKTYLNPLLEFFDPTKPEEIIRALRGRREGYFETFHDSGWVESKRVPPPDVLAALAAYRRQFANNAVSPMIVQQVMDQVLQWREQGIRVFAFRVPSSLAMEQLESEESGFDEGDFVRRFNGSGGEWVPMPRSDEYFSYDGSHLEDVSARKFSRTLGVGVGALLLPQGSVLKH